MSSPDVVATTLLDAVTRGVEVIDLGRPLFAGMPQSPNHPPFQHALVRRHGDMVRDDGGSAANDVIVTGTHVGTHIDALCHVSHQGVLHGGADAAAAQTGGRFRVHGAETIAPIVARGVLFDVPAALGLPALPAGFEIEPAHLEACAVDLRPGDVAYVRSGWAQRWDDPVAYIGRESGVPGVGEAGARWLAETGVRAAGADTIAFERLAPGAGHAVLPAHRVLLVEHGIHIVETLDLEPLARRGARHFVTVIAPLAIVGATGSPVRPLALIG